VTDAKVIDFDAFRREQTGEPVLLKIEGVEYSLPPDMPATVALDVIRLNRDMGAGGNVPPDVLLSIGEGLFGDEQFRKIVKDHKLSVPDMGALIRETLKAYNSVTEQPPNRETRRAQEKATARSGS
jgi:hypothetical protein